MNRFVIDALNEGFKKAFCLGANLSFDEATLASKCAFLSCERIQTHEATQIWAETVYDMLCPYWLLLQV